MMGFALVPTTGFSMRVYLVIAVLGFSLLASAAHAERPLSMPGGLYRLDNRHTSITFKINHLGFSHFTGRFDKIAGTFDYKPDAPEQSGLDVIIQTGSVDTNDGELDETLCGAGWFDTMAYPKATFHATAIEMTGDDRMKIIGHFTLHNVTRVLALDAVLVGAGKEPFTGDEVIGFSASGSFDRSDYDMRNLLPFVGDQVTLQIESEFDKEM
jgi:polyisoprenoid-binding protein YceI